MSRMHMDAAAGGESDAVAGGGWDAVAGRDSDADAGDYYSGGAVL